MPVTGKALRLYLFCWPECCSQWLQTSSLLPVVQERDTPLHKAARAGNADRIWALLESGQDPTAQDVRGRTPYAMASEKTARDTFRRSAGCCMPLFACASWLAHAPHRAQTVGKSHAGLQGHSIPGAAALPGLKGTSDKVQRMVRVTPHCLYTLLQDWGSAPLDGVQLPWLQVHGT